MSRGRWQWSRRGRVAAGLVGVVVVLAGGGAVWLRDDDAGAPETQELGDVVVEQLWSLDLPAREGSDENFEGDVPLVAIDGDSVFVARHGRLQAIDVASGEQRWEVTLERVIRGLHAADGVVAVRLEAPFDPDDPDRPRGELAVFDGERGDRLWGDVVVDETGDNPAFELVIAGDLVVADLDDHGLRAFDLASGELRWRQPDSSNPCWDGSTLTALDGGVVRLSPVDGEPVAGPVDVGPAGDHLLCSRDAVVAVGVDQASVHDPVSLEAVTTLPSVRCCEVDQLVDGPTFVADILDDDTDDPDCCPHTLVALDAASGEELWRYQSPVVGSSELRYRRVDDMLVFTNEAPEGSEDGEESEQLTRLVDGRGEPVGDIETGVDIPSVLESDPAAGTFVIGDDDQLATFRVLEE